MPFTDCFSPIVRSKQTISGRPPTRQASVSVFDPRCCARGPTPTANAAPCLRPWRGLDKVPSLQVSPASRRYAWPERRLTLLRVSACPLWGVALACANALAVGVFNADTCGRRILLDLSVALQGSASGANRYLNPARWILPATWISPVLGGRPLIRQPLW